MNAHAIGQRLAELLRENNNEAIYAELYSPDILSVEAGGPNAEFKGMEAINGKNEWWHSTFELDSFSFEGPFPHGEDQFAMIFDMATTHRESGAKNEMREVAVYKVADGKIVEERFFYVGGGDM